MSIGPEIKANIISFYKKVNSNPPANLANDDIITILIYIFVRADLPSLAS